MKIFLSYSHQDQSVAEQFRDGLTQCGLEVWSDRFIHPGEGMIESIASALSEAEVIVPLFGRPSTSTSWTSLEAGMAIAAKKPIVPVLIDSRAEVPVLLRGLRQFHATDSSARQRQIEQLCLLLREPIEARSTPAALEAVREATEALGKERMAYEVDLARRSQSLTQTQLITASAAVVAAGLALLAVSTGNESVIAAISAGVFGALIAAAILILRDSRERL